MKLIIFDICDNDFGHDLKEAVTLAAASGLYERAGEDCVWWKRAVVKLTVGLQHLAWFDPPLRLYTSETSPKDSPPGNSKHSQNG